MSDFATLSTIVCQPSLVHGDSPSKNTGVCCHFLLQGISPTQGSNPGLPHCRQALLIFVPPGKPLTSPSTQGYGFSSGRVWMWELDWEEGWVSKNWCFWTVMLEKTLESHLDCREIQPVHSEGDQPWDFLGRNDAKAETPVLWPPHAKSWLIGKDPDAGRDWGQEEKGTTEDEMAGWHHRLDGHESE